jgi:hypothetical protein
MPEIIKAKTGMANEDAKIFFFIATPPESASLRTRERTPEIRSIGLDGSYIRRREKSMLRG